MRNDSRMNRALRVISLVTGGLLLFISIFWSQDGFNFGVAGDSGYGRLAVVIGYTLAFSVTVIQFVFSTNFKELNPSLILFGLLAYAYSVYTNYQGILHFQGFNTDKVAALILGFCMDGIPEPLIAWSLRESLRGDFVGNIFNTVGNIFRSIMDGNSSKQEQPPKRIPDFNTEVPSFRNPKKGKGREFHERGEREDKPNRFDFGE